MAAEPTKYLGEVMVHKPSRKAGPIVRAGKLKRKPVVELTLKTYDGLSVKGPVSEFVPASLSDYLSFVEGFLSNVPVAMY